MKTATNIKVGHKSKKGPKTISLDQIGSSSTDRKLSKTLAEMNASGRLQTIQAIKRGIEYATFETLQEEIQVSREALAKTINIASRTLHRRKKEGKFHSDESERVVRVATLFDKTLALFDGDINQARRWFNTSKKALGGKTPLEFADTEPGAQEVSDLIGRLEHGVFT